MTKKNKPWSVQMLEGTMSGNKEWVFLARYEHQFQAKQHVNDYYKLYDDDLLSDAEKIAAGPMVQMRVKFDGD
jgi:hypothetical protein